MICDEPISSLDVSVQASLMNLLVELQESKGTSYLFISHDLAAVRHLSDWIAVVYLGRILEIGSAHDVFAPPYHPYTEALLSAIPVPDPDARGGFLNLSLHHTCVEMYRATLEGLGCNLYENFELFRRCGFRIEVVRSIGGGAKSDFWSQMIADITGLPIERPVFREAGVVGAAMIAAVGSGAFSSLEEGSEALYQRERIFSPDPENHALYEKLCRNYIGLYRRVYHQPE
jgi:sugar (pentulose or hexulose) kinase